MQTLLMVIGIERLIALLAISILGAVVVYILNDVFYGYEIPLEVGETYYERNLKRDVQYIGLSDDDRPLVVYIENNSVVVHVSNHNNIQ